MKDDGLWQRDGGVSRIVADCRSGLGGRAAIHPSCLVYSKETKEEIRELCLEIEDSKADALSSSFLAAHGRIGTLPYLSMGVGSIYYEYVHPHPGVV